MSVSPTAGVSALAKVLRALAGGATPTVTEMARSEGIPRASAFELVARLERAGFISRDRDGRLAPGAAAVQLGFARGGLAPLHGPAEAVLLTLAERTGGAAALRSTRRSLPQPLVGLEPSWQSAGSVHLEQPVGSSAVLALDLPPDTPLAAGEAAARELEQAASTLAAYLDQRPA